MSLRFPLPSRLGLSLPEPIQRLMDNEVLKLLPDLFGHGHRFSDKQSPAFFILRYLVVFCPADHRTTSKAPFRRQRLCARLLSPHAAIRPLRPVVGAHRAAQEVRGRETTGSCLVRARCALPGVH